MTVEREAVALQLADAAEPAEMVVTVDGVPSVALGALEQALRLVEADGVDRDVGRSRQLGDAILHVITL